MIISTSGASSTPTDSDQPQERAQLATETEAEPSAAAGQDNVEPHDDKVDQDDLSCNVHDRSAHEASYNADDDATVELSSEEAQRQRALNQQAPLQKVSQVSAVAATTTTTTTTTSKRRSSWRHLLSPSYKSRSDEFHKFFANEIPKGERLIADYSCALHREFLIQGRLYVSINYLAFYSNLFSWITKCVVRLRDIRDICKANTAKIIPNAIQILTHSNEKHVFASFIARDKSFILIWRIWRNNNLLKERLSDQEIKKLVHLGYGKDLGLNDLEESKISAQPLPRTPAIPFDAGNGDDDSKDQRVLEFQHRQLCNKVTSALLDQNNNKNNRPIDNGNSMKTQRAKRSRFKSRSQNQKDLMSLVVGVESGRQSKQQQQASKQPQKASLASKRGHARFSSVDYGKLGGGQQQIADANSNSNDQTYIVLDELPVKLAEPSAAESSPVIMTPSARANDNDDLLLDQTCSPASSAVIVDTPASIRARRRSQERQAADDELASAAPADGGDAEGRQIFAPSLAEAQPQLGSSAETTSTIIEHVGVAHSPADVDSTSVGTAASEEQSATAVASEQSSSNTVKCSSSSRNAEENRDSELAGSAVLPASAPAAPTIARQFDPMGPPLNTKCDCESHDGFLVADEELDINVDILFSLIFTNSKFMRAHMMQRGQYDLVIGKWRRPTNGGDRSNSSTLSSRDSDQQQSVQVRQRQGSVNSQRGDKGSSNSNFKTQQVRQLNYSMDVNHVLAKQVKVEERQNICQVRPGVYVLVSQTVNSGFPCSESFTVDLRYCLTRTSHLNKSRLTIHGQVNFLKEKQNWRLAMVKPIIEKQSVQGVVDFTTDLIASIKEYIESKKQQSDPTVYIAPDDDESVARRISPLLPSTNTKADPHADSALSNRQQQQQPANHQSRSSLARAKSKLKERKLRNMYKYYIQAVRLERGEEEELGGGGGGDRSQRGESGGDEDDDARSINSCMSSSMSSMCEMNDDESMIMMMATTGHNGGGHINNSTQNHLRYHYHASHLDDYDDDVVDNEDDHHGHSGSDYDAFRRAPAGDFLTGRRSFSDLEDGPMNGRGIDQDSDVDDHQQWRSRKRQLGGGNTSSATPNNEPHLGRRPWRDEQRERRMFGWPGRPGQDRRPSSYSKIVPDDEDDLTDDQSKQQLPEPAGRRRHARQRHPHGRALPSAHPVSKLYQAEDLSKQQQQQQQQKPLGRLFNRLCSTRSLVSLMLISLLLLVLAMIVSHAIILRRLAQVENLLMSHCNSSLSAPWSAPLPSPYSIQQAD